MVNPGRNEGIVPNDRPMSLADEMLLVQAQADLVDP